MKIEKKDLKKSRYLLKISLEPKELIIVFKEQYQKLAPEVKIPGFRPGKAPRKLIEESLGQGRLLSESLDQIIQNSYVEAVQKEKLIPVSAPKITISKYPNWGLEEAEVKETLEYEAELDVMPKVELKDYSKIKIKKRELKQVEESDIEKVLVHLQRQKANFLEIDRPAKIGDRVEISYEGSVKGVKKDAMTAKNHPLVLGDNTLIPGFEQEIVGMKKGEKKKFSINFPKDYRAKDFAGQMADFEVELIDLREIQVSNLDDQFAKNFGHDKVSDLRAAIKKSLHSELEEKVRSEEENELIEMILPFLVVEVPENLIEQEIDRTISGLEKQIQSKGLSFDKYLESLKKTLEDFRKDIRPTAIRNVKIGFLLGKIIEEQKIDHKNPEAGKMALNYLKKQLIS